MPTARSSSALVLAHQDRKADTGAESEISVRPLIDEPTIVLAVVSIVFALVQKVESGHLMSTTERLMSELLPVPPENFRKTSRPSKRSCRAAASRSGS